MRKIFSSQKCDSLAGSEGACAGTGWITWIFAMLSHDLRSLMERGGSPNESVPALTARRCLPPLGAGHSRGNDGRGPGRIEENCGDRGPAPKLGV